MSVKKIDGKCIVTIADSGNEIPEDMNIFAPFVTDNSARTFGQGTGLGLAVTKRIIDKHNGIIRLNRNVDGYTKAFVIELAAE